MVAISTIGAATGGVYAGSRVMYTTARDGNLIETLSLLHNKFQTPVMALIVQVCNACSTVTQENWALENFCFKIVYDLIFTKYRIAGNFMGLIFRE